MPQERIVDVSGVRELSRGDHVRLAGTVAKTVGQVVGLNVRVAAQNRFRGYRGWIGAEVTDYDPLDPVTAADPYPAYARLHAGGRVHYSPKRNVWVLSRFEHVREAARADDVFINGEGSTLTRIPVPIVVTSDNEVHARLRRQIQPAFTRPAMQQWAPVVEDLARDLVAQVVADPGCDVVRRLAIPLPMTVISRLLGVPEKDIDDFRAWSTDATSALDFELTPRGLRNMRASATGTSAIWRYFNEQLRDGTLTASDTLLARLVAENDGELMSRLDLFLITLVLLIAGNETTTNLLGGLFDSLGRNPDQYQLLRERPELIPAAVEEQLRFCSPIQLLYRTAVRDYRIEHVTIPSGARVLISFGAANRDPDVFDEPDRFDIERGAKLQHLAFGYGVHMCVGAALARLEAAAVLRELVRNVSHIDLFGETIWSQNSSLHGPVQLHTRLVPAT
jgi:cytochrome P450